MIDSPGFSSIRDIQTGSCRSGLYFQSKFLELARTPIGINLGIFGAILVPLLAQSNVRSGLIGLSLASLFVMTGLVFSGVVFSAYGLIFLAARLLRSWACRRGKAGLPLIAAWIFVNALYLPVFFITYPPFEGFMAAGEIALFFGALDSWSSGQSTTFICPVRAGLTPMKTAPSVGFFCRWCIFHLSGLAPIRNSHNSTLRFRLVNNASTAKTEPRVPDKLDWVSRSFSDIPPEFAIFLQVRLLRPVFRCVVCQCRYGGPASIVVLCLLVYGPHNLVYFGHE